MFISNEKIASATLLGILVGLRFHHTWAQERILGRDAYLVHQGQHFDKFLAAPHSILASIFGGLFVVAVIVGVYELLSTGISRILGDSPGSKEKTPGAVTSGL